MSYGQMQNVIQKVTLNFIQTFRSTLDSNTSLFVMHTHRRNEVKLFHSINIGLLIITVI